MKKLLIVLLVFTFVKAEAQSDSTKFFQQINAGAILGSTASTTFKGGKQPFDVGQSLFANVCVIAPKTYHSLLYGFSNNSLTTLHGYLLKNNWDTYGVYSKNLSSSGQYLAAGIEKMIPIKTDGGSAGVFLFSEFGTDLRGTKILSFGVLLSFQNTIWKRRKS